MSENKAPNKIELSDEQKKGLIDLPNCELSINYICKSPSINFENNKISTPMKKGVVRDASAAYNLNKIIEFLKKGFDKRELFEICMQRSDDDFYDLYREIKDENLTQPIIVQKMVDFAERKGIENELLRRAKKINPNRYDEYVPFEIESEFPKGRQVNPDT